MKVIPLQAEPNHSFADVPINRCFRIGNSIYIKCFDSSTNINAVNLETGNCINCGSGVPVVILPNATINLNP